MKKTLILILLLSTLFGCNTESSTKIQSNEKVEFNTKKNNDVIEQFDCMQFFSKGDYSSLCFTNSKSPEYIGAGCIFDFKVLGNKHEQSLKSQFTFKRNESLAKMHFNLNKSNYKKGTTTDIADLGDEAFFDIHTTDLKSLSRSNKDLHVRYKNLCFTLFSEYQSDSTTPCFYNDKDLVAFAKEIIENL